MAALWIWLRGLIESGVALRLPPHSKWGSAFSVCADL